MRKLLLVFLMVVFICGPLHAASDEIVTGMGKKLARGVVDLTTGIVELPMQVKKGYDNGVESIENEGLSKTTGTVFGFFRGLSHTAGRMYSGVLDVVGFWTANPQSNAGIGIPFDAEYSWQEGNRHNIFEPNLGDGFAKPVFLKLGHGVANAGLGLAEIPGQIKVGVKEGETIPGVVRGFWYGLSREFYGITTAYTMFAPNHEETAGYAFSHDWPWEALTQ